MHEVRLLALPTAWPGTARAIMQTNACVVNWGLTCTHPTKRPTCKHACSIQIKGRGLRVEHKPLRAALLRRATARRSTLLPSATRRGAAGCHLRLLQVATYGCTAALPVRPLCRRHRCCRCSCTPASASAAASTAAASRQQLLLQRLELEAQVGGVGVLVRLLLLVQVRVVLRDAALLAPVP